MKTNCLDTRNKCGTSVASACVPYTGADLENINTENIPCNPNINDILSELDATITTIKEAISITGLDKECLEECNCDATTIKSVFQLLITQLCQVITKVQTLEDSINNIGAIKFTADLSCFANPCFNASDNQYSLIEIINLLLTELCNLKNSI